MTRAYWRALPDLYERKAFGTPDHPPYSPDQLGAFVGMFCFGEQQQPRGRFKSERMLRALLEGPDNTGRRFARAVPFLIAQRDLIVQPDGTLYIEGWDELQEGDWKVADRMSRYRGRKSRGEVTPPTVTDVTPTNVYSPEDTFAEPSERKAVERISGLAGGRSSGSPVTETSDRARLQKLAEELTRTPYVLPGFHGGFGQMVAGHLEQHGLQAVELAWRVIAERHGGRATIRQLAFEGEDELNPIARNTPKADKERRQQERADLIRRIEQEARDAA